jgi:hypothetical protein
VVSVTGAYDRIHGFLDRSLYYFFQVVPQLYLRGGVDPVPDPLLLLENQKFIISAVTKETNIFSEVTLCSLVEDYYIFWERIAIFVVASYCSLM